MAEGGHKPRGQNINPSSEPNIARQAILAEGDQVVQHFENSTVNVVAGDQYNYDIHVTLPPGSYQNNLDQEKLRLEAEQGFLAKTKIHLRKEIRVNQKLTARPTMMIIDMKGTSAEGVQSSHVDGKSLFGRDLEAISLDQIHDPWNEKPPKHVTILGEAGAGKSTLSEIYSLDVADGNVKTLDNIQVVYFVSAATLQTRSTTTAFRLLFTEQMNHDPETKLSTREQEAGAEWLQNNSSKLLITIDGLDQCLEEFGKEKYPRVSEITLAKANDIIANIMSGRIWRDARILTTTRWNTYWNIKADQKPDKVVGLRGLDDKNLKDVAFSQSIDGDLMFTQLEHTSPEILTLCRNPMFLNYMTKIFKKNHSALPDSLSGLMSAFFREFISSSSAKHFRDITKLAYNAMRENIFVFPHSYLDSLGIDPKVLDDFLSTGVDPDDGLDTVTSIDTSSQFAHQTMQEFCCALHVTTLTREEVKEFVATQLNESRMELTRQLLYGLILDEKVTKLMSKYLSINIRTSIQECRKILLEELLSMMKSGTIREVQTMKLLSECGDETVENMKNNVQRIEIVLRQCLQQNDRILLASMINRLSPLEEVSFNQFNLEPSLIPPVKRFLSSVAVFKVNMLVIEDTHLTHESLVGYSDILRQCLTERIDLYKCELTKDHLIMIAQLWQSPGIQLQHLEIDDAKMSADLYREISFTLKSIGCNKIWFSNCNLTIAKLSEFYIGCKENDLTLQRLTIIDRTMPSEAYSDVADVVKTTECTHVVFNNCDLSKEKLKYFGSNCKEIQVSLQKLTLLDNSMEEDQYEILSHVLKVSDCKELQLQGCCLTETKLQGLLRGCRNQNVQLQKLTIIDRTMPSEAYSDVAAVVKTTECTHVAFGNCNLSKEKLKYFGSSCKEIQVSLQKLHIIDRTMHSEGYADVAAVVKMTTCSRLVFENCDLCEEKLKRFGSSCKEIQVSLQKLTILDNSMEEDQYEILGHILKVSDCKELQLERCCLTETKLQGLLRGCRNQNIQLQKLTILDNSMEEDQYEILSHILKVSDCKELHLQECCLTETKLQGLLRGFRNQNIQLPKLAVFDRTMLPDAYSTLAAVVKSSKCTYVCLGNCDLSEEKLECFGMGCMENRVTLPELTVSDRTMPPDAYSALAAVVKSSNCTSVGLGNCDLSEEKLECFGMGCLENQVTIPELHILDGDMPADPYSALAAVIKFSKCAIVCFVNCKLSIEKLECFRMGCEEKQVSLQTLGISDNSMTENEYEILTHILKLSDCKWLVLEQCCLTKATLRGLIRGCRNQSIQLQYLVLLDSTVPSVAYSTIAAVVETSKCKLVGFGKCDSPKENVKGFRMGYKENQVAMQRLVIDWSQSTATEDEISALCDLTTFDFENVDLFTWEVDAKGTQILPNTLQIESSKVTEIRFSKGDVLTNSRPQEEPTGQDLQNTRNRGNTTILQNRNDNRPKRCMLQ